MRDTVQIIDKTEDVFRMIIKFDEMQDNPDNLKMNLFGMFDVEVTHVTTNQNKKLTVAMTSLHSEYLTVK